MMPSSINLLDNPFLHFQCGMFIKDTKGRYTWVNDHLLKLQKLERHEILGKTDIDLPWSGHMKELRLHDQSVLDQKRAVTFHEVIHRRGYDVDGFCHKSPVYHESGQLIGVCGIFIDSPRNKLSVDIKLSVRERQCLLNLARGMTAKESATQLKLSFRTVEDYLEKLRGKLHCKNQAELISFYHENLSSQFRP